MKLASVLMAVTLMAGTCVTQMPPQNDGGDPHSGMEASQDFVASSRVDFGQECGIHDVSTQSAIGLIRSQNGTWSKIGNGNRPRMMDNAVARVWRESNWMVDIHDAPTQGVMSIHTGQLCFNSRGQIAEIIDRYMEMGKCDCVRFTALRFAEDGRIMRRTQRFMKLNTGEEIPAPKSASQFPVVWDFRRLDQLPFYSLVKK